MAAVLLIDDDALVGETLGNALRNVGGHETVVVNSGQKGLAELGKNPIDVVICDIVMVGMDGYEVISHVREHLADVPVIAISGGGLIKAHAYLEMARDLGVVRTLQKPIPINDLLDAVADALP